jgi:hypothetical protein
LSSPQRIFEIGRQWDAASAAPRLRRLELATDVRLTNSHFACAPVEITPAQSKKLALAQTSHRGHQVERPLDPAQCVVGSAELEDGAELGLRQVPDVLGLAHCGKIHALAWVLRDQPTTNRQLEDGVQRAEDVADRLRLAAQPS